MLRKAALEHLTKYLNTSSQVLLRADFNVPIKDGKITDPNRIIGNFHELSQKPSQPSMKLPNTIQSLWSCYHILEDQMERKTQK